MTENNLEPQDEMKEVMEESSTDLTTEAEQVAEEFKEEVEKEYEGMDKNDPKVKAGMEIMKRQLQDSFDKRVNKIIGKTKAMQMDMEAKMTAKFSELEELKKLIVKPTEKPNIADFDDPNDFVEASMNFFKQKAPKPQPAAQESYDPQLQKFSTLEQEYAKTHPDYFEKVESIKPFLNKNTHTAIVNSSPEVADYLADNVEVLEELAGLNPVQIGYKLAQIENSIKRRSPLPKKAMTKPEPSGEIRGTNTGGYKDITKMNQAEYNKYMATI